MGLVFVTPTADRNADELDNAEPLARFNYGGVYFFLYPGIRRLRELTGLFIASQTDAFFAGDALDDLASFIQESEDLLAKQPASWEQHVGTRYGTAANPTAGEPWYLTTQRDDVRELLDGLTNALNAARRQGIGVLFFGE